MKAIYPFGIECKWADPIGEHSGFLPDPASGYNSSGDLLYARRRLVVGVEFILDIPFFNFIAVK